MLKKYKEPSFGNIGVRLKSVHEEYALLEVNVSKEKILKKYFKNTEHIISEMEKSPQDFSYNTLYKIIYNEMKNQDKNTFMSELKNKNKNLASLLLTKTHNLKNGLPHCSFEDIWKDTKRIIKYCNSYLKKRADKNCA